MSFENPPERIRPDDGPGITICGYPKPGEIVWAWGAKYRMNDDGYMYLVLEDEDPYEPSFGEKVAAKLMCPACFLPRFIPGHKFRGCDGRYSF